jgi:plasmid stabilization system protein ParE
MRVYFHPDAEAEFDKAIEYYEQLQPGLDIEFAEEIYATITRIIQYPDAWSVLSKNSRRCLVNRFPYGVVYQIKTGSLRIIAVAHLHRRPSYWKERLKQNERLHRIANKHGSR